MNASPEKLQKLNSITVQLSEKEAIQNSKRLHCSALFDQIQALNQQLESLRKEVQITQEQLLEIDDEIDLFSRQRDHLLHNDHDDDEEDQSQYPDNLTQMQFGVVDLGIQEEECQDGPDEYEYESPFHAQEEQVQDVDGHFKVPSLGQVTQIENQNNTRDKSTLHNYFSSNRNKNTTDTDTQRQQYRQKLLS